jgi:hypothetical protein
LDHLFSAIFCHLFVQFLFLLYQNLLVHKKDSKWVPDQSAVKNQWWLNSRIAMEVRILLYLKSLTLNANVIVIDIIM